MYDGVKLFRSPDIWLTGRPKVQHFDREPSVTEHVVTPSVPHTCTEVVQLHATVTE